MDAIILWSGWIIALLTFSWGIYQWYKNRSIVKITTKLNKFGETYYFGLEILNFGRKPIKIIRQGFLYTNGENEDIVELNTSLVPFTVYKALAQFRSLSLGAIKHYTKGRVNDLASMYFIDEEGNNYITKIPDNVKGLLRKQPTV